MGGTVYSRTGLKRIFHRMILALPLTLILIAAAVIWFLAH